MGIIDDHLAAARRRIRTCYSLAVGENLLDLPWPFAIGLAIDGLIDNTWAGVAVLRSTTTCRTKAALRG